MDTFGGVIHCIASIYVHTIHVVALPGSPPAKHLGELVVFFCLIV